MDMELLVEQIKVCATFFYQNREQEAYDSLNTILPYMNQALQNTIAASKMQEENVVSILTRFMEAYQVRDQLALADVLEYEICECLAGKI